MEQNAFLFDIYSPMKVLLSGQVKAADRYTIENEPIASVDLMERACHAFVGELERHFGPERPVWIFCGTGNNGGDGLGIARLLLNKKYSVRILTVGNVEKGSADFRTNYERAKTLTTVEQADAGFAEQPPAGAFIIDALFGTGLSRPAEGAYAAVIKQLNSYRLPIVAVDVPTGLFCEQPQGTAPAIEAQLTISFQAPKLAFFMPENFRYTGEWRIADIGLSKSFLAALSTPYHYQLACDPGLNLPPRPKFMHKGMAGRVLLAGGSRGKVGAILLAARACLRAGGGLVTVHGPGCVAGPLHASSPEAMMQADDNDNVVTQIPTEGLSAYDAVGAGPGLGLAERSGWAFHELIANCSRPMVLDADALNLLAQNPRWLKEVPKGSILTPHTGEFKRLAGEWANDYERLKKQQGFAKAYGLIVVVKGAYTTICTPEGQVYFNSTGNPGMASGGSGDVLTGVVAALLGQGLEPERAARLGVWLHGLAGDLAAREKGEYGLIASDIVEKLPEAFDAVVTDST